MTDQDNAAAEPVVIKKYANRRLYNTASSAYVTLDDLSVMVKEGTDFLVHDAKTGEDITRQVLTQIIFEEEAKGQNLLPIDFLRQLIRFYGDSMQAFVPGYLQFSLENLAREQEKLREQLMGPAGNEMYKSMEDQARKNMAMFQEAMSMFNPFAAMGGQENQASTDEKPQSESSTPPNKDLESLRAQIRAMQSKIDELADVKDN